MHHLTSQHRERVYIIMDLYLYAQWNGWEQMTQSHQPSTLLSDRTQASWDCVCHAHLQISTRSESLLFSSCLQTLSWPSCTMIRRCWKTIIWQWASNSCRRRTVTSSRTWPKNRDNRCARWSSTSYVPLKWHVALMMLDLTFFSRMFLQGLGDWYVQTHEPAGRSEDHGRDQEGHQFWSLALG